MKKPVDILMFSMSTRWEWEFSGLRNRNYFLLQELLKRPDVGRVFVVDFLPLSIKRAVRYLIRDRREERKFASQRKKLVTKDGRLFFYNTNMSLFGQKALRRDILKVLKKISFAPDLVWSYTPLTTVWLDLFPSATTVFDAVDDWRHHSAYTRKAQLLSENYEYIEKKAKYIFCVASSLVDIFPSRTDVQWVPNGVAVEYFSHANDPVKVAIVKQKINDFSRPIVGYAGIIESRFDVALVELLTQRHPEYSFVFLGWVWPELEKRLAFIQSLPNVHFLGQQPYQLLPYFFAEFTVGLVPHAVTAFTRSMNPMKFYEYLAAGLPVVSSAVAGSDQFGPDVEVAGTADEFDQKLVSLIQRQTRLSPVAALAQRRERQNRAQQYDWKNRSAQMWSIVTTGHHD